MWHQAHPQWRKLSIAVNVSVRQLLRPDFVDMVTRVVRECGIPAQCLTLELTESVIIERPDLIFGRAHDPAPRRDSRASQ